MPFVSHTSACVGLTSRSGDCKPQTAPHHHHHGARTDNVPYSDGSWGRASDQAWFYSHIIDEKRPGGQGECFWLDHRGSLDHTEDLQDDFILKAGNMNKFRTVDGEPFKYDRMPAWLWAQDVPREDGLPRADDLSEGSELLPSRQPFARQETDSTLSTLLTAAVVSETQWSR